MFSNEHRKHLCAKRALALIATSCVHSGKYTGENFAVKIATELQNFVSEEQIDILQLFIILLFLVCAI